MLFLERSARLFLILHGVVGAAVVAATTHLVVWSWRLLRGQKLRLRGARWLAVAAAILYVAQLALGNLLYPVYKVRVRAEYLDSPSAVADDARTRRAHRMGAAAPEAPPPLLDRLARAFDIKEHVTALGLALALAAAFVVRRVDEGGGGLLVFCAVGAAACAWFGGLVGLWVASFRSVGGL